MSELQGDMPNECPWCHFPAKTYVRVSLDLVCVNCARLAGIGSDEWVTFLFSVTELTKGAAA